MKKIAVLALTSLLIGKGVNTVIIKEDRHCLSSQNGMHHSCLCEDETHHGEGHHSHHR